MPVFPSDKIEGQIERKYVPTLIELGLSEKEASEEISRFAQKTDWTQAVPNRGDHLLELAKRDESCRAAIEKRKSYGIRDDDIRSWFNTHPFEQICLLGIHGGKQRKTKGENKGGKTKGTFYFLCSEK